MQAPKVWEELLTEKVEAESHLQMQESRLKHSNPLAREISRRKALSTALLPGDSWTKRGSHSTPGTLLPVVEATCEHKGADPGPTSAGAVPVHPAPGVPGPSSGASSREWGRGSDHTGESGKKEKCTYRKRQV